mmetsp:Transcript_36559/g.91349  ORF Transcript_36559/g.91349 Transcript_36559/m.91349 type:complete len:606 (+) Transcript_36559:252-2069(+)
MCALCAPRALATHAHDAVPCPLHATRSGRVEERVAILLELERQLGPATPHDLALGHNVHVVGLDVVEQPLIVRDQHDAVGVALVRVHTLRDRLERVDVQPRVRLVQDCKLGLEQRHLEDLVALLLATREAAVHLTVEEVHAHPHRRHLLAEDAEKLDRVVLALSEGAAALVDSEAQKVGVGDTRDLDRVLERKEDTLLRALLRLQVEQVLALAVVHRAAGDLVRWVPHDHLGKGALPRAVRPHDRMDLAALDAQVHPLQDRRVLHGGLQILHVQQHVALRHSDCRRPRLDRARVRRSGARREKQRVATRRQAERKNGQRPSHGSRRPLLRQGPGSKISQLSTPSGTSPATHATCPYIARSPSAPSARPNENKRHPKACPTLSRGRDRPAVRCRERACRAGGAPSCRGGRSRRARPPAAHRGPRPRARHVRSLPPCAPPRHQPRPSCPNMPNTKPHASAPRRSNAQIPSPGGSALTYAGGSLPRRGPTTTHCAASCSPTCCPPAKPSSIAHSSSAISCVACGVAAARAASAISSSFAGSWIQAETRRPMSLGSCENSPKPDAVTKGTLPASCPGKYDESIVGKPRIAASAIVPGPALVTRQSATSM